MLVAFTSIQRLRSRNKLANLRAVQRRDVSADGDFGGAFGAARLGLIAAAGTTFEQVCTPPRTAKTIKPDTRLREAYEAQYARYVQIYPAIKEIDRP